MDLEFGHSLKDDVMAIYYRCTCGQKIAAQDRDAGRRMLCPVCNAEAFVPQSSTEGSTVATDPAASAQARSQARTGLVCGILAFVFLALLFGISLFIGAKEPAQGGFAESFRHGYEKGLHDPKASMTLSLVFCGLWGVSVLLSVAAITFGALGRKRINLHNRGVATAGLALGIVCLSFHCCCGVVMLVAVFAALASMKQ